ncbi:MAG: hypothetical protein RSD22_06165 [Romboutsia sp.]
MLRPRIEKVAYKFILVAFERHFEKSKYKMIVYRAVTRFPCYCSLFDSLNLKIIGSVRKSGPD